MRWQIRLWTLCLPVSFIDTCSLMITSSNTTECIPILSSLAVKINVHGYICNDKRHRITNDFFLVYW